MKNTPEQEAVYTVRRSWGELLRAKAGYLISGPGSKTEYYAERPMPQLFVLPVVIILIMAVNRYDVPESWLAWIIPFAIVAAIFARIGKTAITFYEGRNRRTPLFRAEPQRAKWNLWNRFTVTDCRSREKLGEIVMTDKKSFLPRWEVADPAGKPLLRAAYKSLNIVRERYRLLAGEGDEVVGGISSDLLQREYSILFSGRKPEDIDDRLVVAALTIIFDNRTRDKV